MASLHDLEEMFPHLSRTLIEEVYRLKGNRARTALELLCSDDDVSSKSSTRTSFSTSHMASTSAFRRSSSMGATVKERSIIEETRESETEDGFGVNSGSFNIVKAASTRSGWPDVVLGEELYEVLSCPGGYEISCLDAFDRNKHDHDDEDRDYCLDDLFRMPIEDDGDNCKKYKEDEVWHLDINTETGKSETVEKSAPIGWSLRDHNLGQMCDPVKPGDGQKDDQQPPVSDTIDVTDIRETLDVSQSSGHPSFELHISRCRSCGDLEEMGHEDDLTLDQQTLTNDPSRVFQLKPWMMVEDLSTLFAPCSSNTERAATDHKPFDDGAEHSAVDAMGHRRGRSSMELPGTPASPGTPDAVEAETAESVAWFEDVRKPSNTAPSHGHPNGTVNDASMFVNDAAKGMQCTVSPNDDSDDDYLTLLMMSSVRCNQGSESNEAETGDDVPEMPVAILPLFASTERQEGPSDLIPDSTSITRTTDKKPPQQSHHTTPRTNERTRGDRDGMQDTATDVTAAITLQDRSCVHASVQALRSAMMLRSHLQLLSVAIRDFKTSKSKERTGILKDIRVRINQVSWSQRQVTIHPVLSVSDCLLKSLRSHKDAERKLFILDQLSENIIKCSQGRTHDVDAVPLAYVAQRIMDHYPEFQKILLGHLQRANPLLVPMYWSLDDDSEETPAAYATHMQYQPNMSRDEYLRQQTGVVLFHAALIAVDSYPLEMLPIVRNRKSSFSIDSGWTYMARYVNTIPPDRTTVRFLYLFLKVAGHAMLKRYGRQFVKVLHVIEDRFVVQANDLEDGQADVFRLRKLLEKGDFNQTPKAFEMPQLEESLKTRC